MFGNTIRVNNILDGVVMISARVLRETQAACKQVGAVTFCFVGDNFCWCGVGLAIRSF